MFNRVSASYNPVKLFEEYSRPFSSIKFWKAEETLFPKKTLNSAQDDVFGVVNDTAQTVAPKVEDVANVTTEGSSQNASAQGANSAADTADADIETLQAQVKAKQKELNQIMEQIKEVQSTIKEKENEIASMEKQLNEARSNKEKVEKAYEKEIQEYNDKIKQAQQDAQSAYDSQENKDTSEAKSYQDFYKEFTNGLKMPAELDTSMYDNIINATSSLINSYQTIIATEQSQLNSLNAQFVSKSDELTNATNALASAQTKAAQDATKVTAADDAAKAQSTDAADGTANTAANAAASNNTSASSQNQNSQNNTTDDGIDWDAVYVEGKGYNVYQLARGMAANRNWCSIKKLQSIGLNNTDEIAKRISGAIEKYDAVPSKVNSYLAELACLDADNDGFLTADELNSKGQALVIREYKSAKESGVTVDGKKADAIFYTQASPKTKVNGKDVVFINTGNSYMVVTQDELDILDQHINSYTGDGHVGKDVRTMIIEYFSGVYATDQYGRKSLKHTNVNYVYNPLYFTNSAGIETGYGDMHPGCEFSDDGFYKNYLIAKKAMETGYATANDV